MQGLDEFRLQIAGRALINPRRIEKPVAEHDLAARERRANDLFDMVVAGSRKQDCFHAHAEGFGRTRQDHMPDSLRTRRAPRLTRHDHLETTAAKRLGKGANLRRLAGAFAAFEADEQSGLFGQCHVLRGIHVNVELPVYSIEPKCVKRFSEKPVPEQKHRNKAVRGAGFQSQNSSSSFSAPVAFWVSDPLPTAAFV
ncbi:hypothetical protein D3C86_1302980 [compost metagenome]